MVKCSGQLRAFHRATRAVAESQEAVLREILADNRDTQFGRRHNFARIGDAREFQRRVPPSTYDAYAKDIERIAAGEPNVLTAEPVRLLEPTSGTASGEKLIPYTASLRRQFQRVIAAWIADLFRRRPAVRRGRAYWSISPAFGPPRRTAGGIPIGFDDDTAYLGRIERLAMGRLLAVPSDVARTEDTDDFRYLTLLHLLRAEDLALVSVWNPTFLTALIGRLEDWQGRLCADVRHGRLGMRADVRRAGALESVFRSNASWPEKLRQIWPRLSLISCWGDAAAAWGLPELKQTFPDVEIQPKGLLATEAFVSFPLVDRPGAALAVRSHLFEFEPIGSTDESPGDTDTWLLAHQLDRGGRYRVVVTTGGGLYRYQLRDEVEVVDFEEQCPLLRFLGKSDRVSDLVGEKLSEAHVGGVLNRLFETRCLSPDFAMLVPVDGRPPRYRLYLQGGGGTGVSRRQLAAALQAGLEENPHYRYATRLEQLAPVEVSVLDASSEPAGQIYHRRCVAEGQKPGDVKPAALDPRPGWAEEFAS